MNDWARAARYLGTTMVAGIAAYASYWHMRAVTMRFHEDPVIASLIPLSVDGLLVVATVAMVEQTRARRRPDGWTWAAFLIGVSASLAANVLHAGDNLVARAIAAWPPIALLLTVELISRCKDRSAERDLTLAAPAPAAAVPVGNGTSGVPVPAGTVPPVLTEAAAGAGREPPPAPASTPTVVPDPEPTPLERMRAHWEAERAKGRTPSGAQLDRVAGTRDYGRKLRRQWLAEEEVAGDDQSAA